MQCTDPRGPGRGALVQLHLRRARVSRTRHLGARPARTPGNSGAGLGRGQWPELCSLTVFFLVTIFCSFLAIRSSSSSAPMSAHQDARLGCGAQGPAAGLGGQEAQRQRRDAPLPRDPHNTHPHAHMHIHTQTHARRRRGSPAHPLAASPPPDGGGGWPLNIDFKDSPGPGLPCPPAQQGLSLHRDEIWRAHSFTWCPGWCLGDAREIWRFTV